MLGSISNYSKIDIHRSGLHESRKVDIVPFQTRIKNLHIGNQAGGHLRFYARVKKVDVCSVYKTERHNLRLQYNQKVGFAQ